MNTFHYTMNQRTLWAAALIATAMTCTTAWGQWVWKDSSGRKVFSDTPPPSAIPAKDILRKPAGAASPAPAATPLQPGTTPNDGDAAKVAPSAGEKKSPSLADKVAAKQKEDQAKAETKAKTEEAKQKELRDALLKQREANCDRSKKALATLDSGVRVSRVNDKGEKEVLNESGRNEMAESHRRVIEKDCGPLQ